MNTLLASHILKGQNKQEPDAAPGLGKGQALALLSSRSHCRMGLSAFRAAARALWGICEQRLAGSEGPCKRAGVSV